MHSHYHEVLILIPPMTYAIQHFKAKVFVQLERPLISARHHAEYLDSIAGFERILKRGAQKLTTNPVTISCRMYRACASVEAVERYHADYSPIHHPTDMPQICRVGQIDAPVSHELHEKLNVFFCFRCEKHDINTRVCLATTLPAEVAANEHSWDAVAPAPSQYQSQDQLFPSRVQEMSVV